jgi:hypothetical protein
MRKFCPAGGKPPQVCRIVRGLLRRAEFGLKQFFGERFARLFVLVECLGLVTVFDGVGKDPG